MAHFGGLGCHKLTGPRNKNIQEKVGGIQLTFASLWPKEIDDLVSVKLVRTIILANWEICATHYYIYLVIDLPSNVPFTYATSVTFV